MKNQFYGLIPARGGSKGIKNKNIIDLGGKPLIQYTIEAAKKSRYLGDFIVSSDSKKILNIAKNLNINTHLRPKSISNDRSLMIDVMIDAANELNLLERGYKYIVLLQPTCPLRTERDIDESIKIFKESNADTLLSCYKVDDTHPARMYLKDKKYLKPLLENQTVLNRQDLSDVFHRNGAIYIFKISNILKKIQFGKKLLPFFMREERSLNIDNPFDLKLARLLMKDDKNA